MPKERQCRRQAPTSLLKDRDGMVRGFWEFWQTTTTADDGFRDLKIKNLIERANNLIMSLVTVSGSHLKPCTRDACVFYGLRTIGEFRFIDSFPQDRRGDGASGGSLLLFDDDPGQARLMVGI